MLARKHGGRGWKAYDAHFRQLVGAGHNLHWTELNPSMMAANVLQVGGQSCSICQAHDHRSDKCALAVPQSSSERRPRPYRMMEEVCRCFNRPAGCSSSRCRFEHKCLSCGGVYHGAANCRPKTENPRSRSTGASSHKEKMASLDLPTNSSLLLSLIIWFWGPPRFNSTDHLVLLLFPIVLIQ